MLNLPELIQQDPQKMKFSVIVPSYNQDRFIALTLQNLKELKTQAKQKNIDLEILVFDSESNDAVRVVFEAFKDTIDVLEIKKDAGQYDAINKGIKRCKGEYWTWLNTDDLLDTNGFFKVVEVLRKKPEIDYIYGSVTYIDEHGKMMKKVQAWDLNLHDLVSREASIFQPGSWFKKSFTDKAGLLSDYICCFDYEYICRILKNKAIVQACDFNVANFRYYSSSKSGSIVRKFVEEQIRISAQYGRKWFHFLSWMLYLRLFKHLLLSPK
jgi:glycosyltransferase involved in cell wall biosynthesis